MSHTDAVRRRLAIGLAVLPAALASACATRGRDAIDARPLPPPKLRVGDRWSYERIDRYTGQWQDEIVHEIVEIDPRIRLRLTSRRSSAPLEAVYADPWNALVEQTFDLPLVFAQPMPLLPASGEPGVSRSDETTYTTPGDSGVYPWRQELRNLGWERLTVPAGSFDCLRIERRISFRHPDPFRQNSLRWDLIWYAPQVNRWVQREWSGEYFMPGHVDRGWSPFVRDAWMQHRLTSHVPSPVAR